MTEKKRLLVLGHEASLSGAPKLLLKLLSDLKKEEFRIIIFLKTGGELVSDFFNIGETYLLDSLNKNPNRFVKYAIRFFPLHRLRSYYLKRKFQKFNPNLILNYTVVNSKLFGYIESINCPLITIAQEKKLVINFFDKLKMNNSQVIFKRTNHFLACSKSVKKDLVDEFNIDEHKIDVIYNSVSYFNKPKKYLNKANNNFFYVGMCGGPIYRKGPDIFLNIAKYIMDNYQHEKIEFVWQGGDQNTANYVDFQNEIRLLGLSDVVNITPSSKNVQDFFDKIDLFICSSREEPFGMVILEAGLNKLPVLCFQKSGGPEEILADGRGVILPYCNYSEAAKTIIEIKNNSKLRLRYANKIYNYSNKNYNQNNNTLIVKKIKELIL